jgi:hypothetical protein
VYSLDWQTTNLEIFTGIQVWTERMPPQTRACSVELIKFVVAVQVAMRMVDSDPSILGGAFLNFTYIQPVGSATRALAGTCEAQRLWRRLF